MHDLVIRGGEIVDGTGRRRFIADVAVEGGRVVEIGRVADRGRTELDASGHIVTPGFIDGHTHMDAQMFWDSAGSSSCWHGVTTAVVGNCGFTLAPCQEGDRDLVVTNLEKAEDIPAEALSHGIPDWKWTNFRSYLGVLESLPKGINYAAYVGHSALRTWAMGPAARDRGASDPEIEEMERELADALRAGAIGFSTSRSTTHETRDLGPVPSRLADWNEVCRLVGVMGGLGAGIFELAVEDVAYGPDHDAKAEWFKRLKTLGVTSRVPTTFGIFGVDGDESSWADQLSMVAEANSHGANLFGQVHCRDISRLLSFRTSLPFDDLPVWKELRQEPLERQRVLLEDSDLRHALVESADRGSYTRRPKYEHMEIVDSPFPSRSVSTRAADLGIHPVELIIEEGLNSGFDRFFRRPSMNANLKSVEEMMLFPDNVMTFSDSGAHVSYICDASINSVLLGYWVRERQLFTLEDAVRMITQVPAKRWGLAGRGCVQEGYIADLNIIDPQRIAPTLPTLEHDLPSGYPRIVQNSIGIKATVVGGVVTLLEGADTGERPGQLIRGPLFSSE